MASTKLRAAAITSSVLILALAGMLGGPSCNGQPETEPERTAQTSQASSAAQLVTAPLQLQVLTNSCGANQMQDFFEITNTGPTPINLSDVSIKFWVYDTSGQAIVPHVWTGGCVTGVGGNPSCVHQVQGVTPAATQFSPACGPDPTQQANWEVTITDTDGAQIPPGATWSNIQSALNLADFSNFSPGTADWFSPCLTGSTYQTSSQFAVYYQGKLVFSNGIDAPSCRAPHGTQSVSGVATSSQTAAPVVGPVPPNTPVALAVVLPTQNETALEQFIQDVSDPASPLYRKYLTVPQFAAQYGTAPADYATLVSWASSFGLAVKTYPNNLLIDVSGTAAQIEQALFVNLLDATRPDGTIFIEPDRVPSLDTAVTVDRIEGLNTFVQPVPLFRGNGPLGLLSASDLRNAYLGQGSFGDGVTCQSLTGAGQQIGLVEFDGYFNQDITQYESSLGIVPCTAGVTTGCAPGAIQPTVAAGTLLDGFSGQPTGQTFNNGGLVLGTDEVAVDIEMAIAMAPGATIVPIEGTNPSNVYCAFATLTKADNATPAINQVSSSWGAASKSCIEELAAQGQAFFQASGDHGAYQTDPPLQTCTCQCTLQGGLPGSSTEQFSVCGGADCSGPLQCESITNPAPAGSPPAACGKAVVPPQVSAANFATTAITVVGGTDLSVTAGTPVVWQSESAWPGSGGGIDTSLPLPPYQQSPTLANQLLSTTNRNVPDVAMPATGLFVVTTSCNALAPNGNCPTANLVPGNIGTGSGTSLSAPLWAAFTALVNEAGTKAGLRPVGLLNPALYQIAAGAEYKLVFNDIQDGSNAPNVCGTSFGTTSGWDAVTGLGSPTCGLIPAIEQLAQPPQATVTLTNIEFATSSIFDNFFCNGATPQDLSPVTITCTPETNPDGSISTKVVSTPPQELSCSEHGRGALVEVSCSGTGKKGNISLNVNVTVAIDDCGALGDDNGNGASIAFTDVVPGVAQVNADESCDVFTHICAEDSCNTNSFFAKATVTNTGGF